jgi:hypothetical protein
MESELNRLEGAHAEKLEILRSNGSTARAEEYNRVRVAEREAQLELDIVQGQLNRHRRNHTKMN